MVNAQEWLDKWYPKQGTCIQEKEGYWSEIINFGKMRSEITRLFINNQDLSEKLDCSDFVNLKTLYCSYNRLISLDVSKNVNLERLFCYNNQLTSLDLSNCGKLKSLHCYNNQFTSVKFLNTLPHPEKLINLEIYNSNIQPTDIAIFSKFVNLKILKIGTTLESLYCDDKHNKFFGSLKACQNLTQLESICIEATDVDSGLEYLPESLVEEIASGEESDECSNIKCSPHGTNAKCKTIQDELRPFNYDLVAWQLAHPEKMLISHPELFIQADSREKWINALGDKMTSSQQELQETKVNLPDKVKRITRLESKINHLEVIKNLLEELVIEREHSQDINNWYQRQLGGENTRKRNELWNLILELKWNSQQKDQEIKELQGTIEVMNKLAEPETQDQGTQTDLSNQDYEQQQQEIQDLRMEINKLKINKY